MSYAVIWFGFFSIAVLTAIGYRRQWLRAERRVGIIREEWDTVSKEKNKLEVRYHEVLRDQGRVSREAWVFREKLEQDVRRMTEEIVNERIVWQRQVDDLRRELIETQDYAIRAARAIIEKRL